MSAKSASGGKKVLIYRDGVGAYLHDHPYVLFSLWQKRHVAMNAYKVWVSDSDIEGIRIPAGWWHAMAPKSLHLAVGGGPIEVDIQARSAG